MRNVPGQLFGKIRQIIIGAIHLPPLLGYAEFPGFDAAIANALADLHAFEDGGADAVLFENNYDNPHVERVDPAVLTSLAFIGEKLRAATKLPVGVSVLWNDYRAALSTAKVLGLQFVRIPVFVDTVRTDFGVFEGKPNDIQAFRASIGAEDIALFTDIHVKHADVISKHSLAESARLAVNAGSDALVVTGEWTGKAPDTERLKIVRAEVGDFPILAGSGASQENIRELLQFADGVIVSTSVKTGDIRRTERNVKGYDARISAEKVRELVAVARRKQ